MVLPNIQMLRDVTLCRLLTVVIDVSIDSNCLYLQSMQSITLLLRYAYIKKRSKFTDQFNKLQ